MSYRSGRPLLNSAGMTLIEAVTAVALVGIVTAAFATIYADMKDTYSQNEALREAEDLRVYLASVFVQPELCSNALASAGGGKTAWALPNLPATSTVNIPTVMVRSSRAGSTLPQAVAVSSGQAYSRLLQVNRIYLREPTLNEGGPSRSAIQTVNGQNYRYVSAKLAIDTQARSTFKPIPIREKTVDIVVAVNQATSLIDFCANTPDAAPPNSNVCDAANLTAGNANCVTDAYCERIYYLSGFDSTGKPQCACKSSCHLGPEGATGT